MTPACHMAVRHLRLDALTLVCPGTTTYELDTHVRVCELNRLVSERLV